MLAFASHLQALPVFLLELHLFKATLEGIKHSKPQPQQHTHTHTRHHPHNKLQDWLKEVCFFRASVSFYSINNPLQEIKPWALADFFSSNWYWETDINTKLWVKKSWTLTEAVCPTPDPPQLSWIKPNNPTHMYIQSPITSNDHRSLYNFRRRNYRLVGTHARGQMRAAGGSGALLWRLLRWRPHSHSLSLGCRSCCEASGCGPSSWSPPLNHLYTSVSSTCLWSPPHNAISVNSSRKKQKWTGGNNIP